MSAEIEGNKIRSTGKNSGLVCKVENMEGGVSTIKCTVKQETYRSCFDGLLDGDSDSFTIKVSTTRNGGNGVLPEVSIKQSLKINGSFIDHTEVFSVQVEGNPSVTPKAQTGNYFKIKTGQRSDSIMCPFLKYKNIGNKNDVTVVFQLVPIMAENKQYVLSVASDALFKFNPQLLT